MNKLIETELIIPYLFSVKLELTGIGLFYYIMHYSSFNLLEVKDERDQI